MEEWAGSTGIGVGSPYIPSGCKWYIGLIMKSLASKDRKEILTCLKMISNTHAGCNYMHEAFDLNHPEDYTRSWFAWANALFAELMERLMANGFWGDEVVGKDR